MPKIHKKPQKTSPLKIYSEKEFLVLCPPHTSELLKNELESLGLTEIQVISPSRIRLINPQMRDLIHIALSSRLASRVLMPLAKISFSHERELSKLSERVPWEEVLQSESRFKFQGQISGERGRGKSPHALFISQSLKDGVMGRWKKRTSKPPQVELNHPDLTLSWHLQMTRDALHLEISVDLIGHSLIKRGIRSGAHPAPIKENLAQAIIMASSWDQKSPFYDLMCGQGTIVLEALMRKMNLAPSFFRLQKDSSFSLSAQYLPFWKKRDQKLLQSEVLKICKEGQALIKKKEFQKIWAIDIDSRSLKTLSYTLKSHGLEKMIRLEKADATTYSPEEENGVVICNPPYGKRLQSVTDEEIKTLYHNLGENFKANFKGYHCYILSGELEARKSISLRTSKRMTFFNGPIECRLWEYIIQ